MTVSLKQIVSRLPPERRRKIKARTAELVAAETGQNDHGARRAVYHLSADADGRWHWRLVAATGEILAVSGESYKTRRMCLAGIERLRSATRSDEVALVDA